MPEPLPARPSAASEAVAPSSLAARLASALLEDPCTPAQQLLRWGKTLGRIALGQQPYQPCQDARFSDPRWHQPGIRRRLLQAWQYNASSLQEWLSLAPLTDFERQRLSFLAEQLTDALAPSNSPAHPQFADRLQRDGLAHLRNSLQRWGQDFINNRGLPRQVETSTFQLGQNIATSQGAVVYRHAMFELIHYRSLTPEQHAVPLLIVPPPLNRFYIFDLSPDNSMVRHALEAGLNVFIISWRNPRSHDRDWGLADYSQACLTALEIVRSICQAEQVNLLGACLGGLTCAMAQLTLKQRQQLAQVRSCSYLVTPLDCRSPHPALLLLTPKMRERMRLHSQRHGLLSATELAHTFAWLRAKDLIWRYWTHNYLLGNEPEAFDVLYWNADSTPISAQLHSEILDLIAHDSQAPSLPQDSSGQALDFSQLDNDSFAVAGLSDHITPWQSVYRSMQLLGGKVEFVLARGGHIQAILNPPCPHQEQFWQQPLGTDSAEQWQAQATTHRGSWWPHWLAWLKARSGAYQSSTNQLGNDDYPVLTAAPGHYVRQS